LNPGTESGMELRQKQFEDEAVTLTLWASSCCLTTSISEWLGCSLSCTCTCNGVHMYTIINNHELGISGHSMGGHGALICALKNPAMYKSVSAFAPICNPINCPWGQKAFSGYLGSNQETWKSWDATEIVKHYSGPPFSYILIDQGKEDGFLPEGQLLPGNFVESCREQKLPVVLRMQEGYDHSYYFVSTFIGDHIKHHADVLNA